MPIIDYTPPTSIHFDMKPLDERPPYYSHWDRGEATILLNIGHAEYPLDSDKLTEDTFDIFDHQDDPTAHPIPSWLEGHLPVGEPDFGTIVRLHGNVFDLHRAFYTLANSLDPEQDPADHRPSGDDDTYDYYPSAFECLTHFAEMLDDLDQRLIAHTNNPEDARKFTARQRIISIIQNLRISRGPFEDWEFEDYAAPFLPPSTTTKDLQP